MHTAFTSAIERTPSTPHSEPMIIPTGGAGSAFPLHSLGAFRSAFGISDAIALDVRGVQRRERLGIIEPVIMDLRSLFPRKQADDSSPLHISYESLRSLRRHGEQLVPALDEVLDTYAVRSLQTGKRTELNIRLADYAAAEAAIPRLQQRILAGELSYNDFVVQVPTDGRNAFASLSAIRALDPNIRIGLFVVRGELLRTDPISYSDFLSTARTLGVESISIDRRDLTKAVAQTIRDAGLAVGCHHANTADEIEGALAAGATRIHTGALYGSAREASPYIRPSGSPLFNDLHHLGFYSLRDSLEEIQSALKARTERPDTTTRLVLPLGVDAALYSRGRSRALLQSARAGFGQTPATDLAAVEVHEAYLGAVERGSGPQTWGDLVSFDGLKATFRAYATALAERSLTAPSAEFNELVDALDIISIAELGDSEAATPLRSATPYCGAEELRILEETAREVMTRAGRCLGMLATTGLDIEHGGKELYVVEIDSDILEISTAARIAAREQVLATVVGRGARGQVHFGIA